MKINEDSTISRLKDVPIENRVYIYDGTRLIDFLNRTFVPVGEFIVKDRPFEVRELNNSDWVDGKKGIREKAIPLKELYELYTVFYQFMRYKEPIETRFQFGLLIRRLRFYKNNWEFDVFRVGTAQVWNAAPLVLRSKDGYNAPPPENNELMIDATFKDMQSDPEEEEEDIIPDPLDISVNEDQTQAVVTVKDEETFEGPMPDPIDYPEQNDKELNTVFDAGFNVVYAKESDIDEVRACIQTPEQVEQEEEFLKEPIHPVLPTEY